MDLICSGEQTDAGHHFFRGGLYRLEWTPLLVEQELFLRDVIEAETQENGE